MLGPNELDQDIPLGAAVAELDLANGNAQLFIHSPPTLRYVQLAQQAAAGPGTVVYMILDEQTTGGQSGTCAGCAPDFTARPPTIDVNGASVTYQNAYTRAPMEIDVTTHLQTVAPCSLTFAELAAVNVNLASNFQAEGQEMVWHKASVYQDSPNTQCGTATPYTVDLYVSTAQPWMFGVRNYVAGTSYPYCHQDPPQAG